MLVVDSIQTVFTADLEGAPGNVGQVRECAARLMRFAKESGTAVFVVGHVTKGGGIAGPKTLEHIVDTVLYFEGEGTLDHRVLRATKNRFGSVDEIGVFRMTAAGARSRWRIRPSSSSATGDVIGVGQRGHRAARGLAADPARNPGARREGRLRHAAARAPPGSTAAASRCCSPCSTSAPDSPSPSSTSSSTSSAACALQEPAGDLAVAAALASSVYDRALPRDAVFIGEVGLGGEVRPVSQAERRIAEAAKHGHEPRLSGANAACPSDAPRRASASGVRDDRATCSGRAVRMSATVRATSAW